jgi:hypothetical protein
MIYARSMKLLIHSSSLHKQILSLAILLGYGQIPDSRSCNKGALLMTLHHESIKAQEIDIWKTMQSR